MNLKEFFRFLVKNDISIDQLKESIDMPQREFLLRLSGYTYWSMDEINAIVDSLGMTKDEAGRIFFTEINLQIE